MKKSKKSLMPVIMSVLFLSAPAVHPAFSAELSMDVYEAASAGESESVIFAKKLRDELQNGSIDGALMLFDSLPESLLDDVDLKKLHASLLISAGQYKEADRIVSGLESASPSDIELKEMRIVLSKASGNEQRKHVAIQAVIKADPTTVKANVELAHENVLAHKYKQARSYYQKALVKEPDNQEALFGYGQTSYYLNDLTNSRKAFNKILADDPENAVAYSYIAKLEAENSNYKRAEENIRKAIAYDAGAYDFYMDLGNYVRQQGKFAEAEKAWSKAISLDPTYFLAYAYRAGLYDEQNKYEQALQDYRMVVKTNPKYYFAYESLGMLAWRIGSWDEARSAFEKAYSYNKTNISYPLIISACYLKAGKKQQAKQFLETAMKDYQDHSSSEYVMLRLYHDLGPSVAENDMALRIQKETSATKRGKFLYYFALFYEIKKNDSLAKKYYAEIKTMNSPMFFEYRLAEWSLEG